MMRGYGHPFISAQHKNSIELTPSSDISKEADCVICVNTRVDAAELQKLKAKVKVMFSFFAGDETEVVIGYGHPDLQCEGFILRKSNVIDKKTLCIYADKGASDLKRSFVEKLKNKEQNLIVKIKILEEYDHLDFYEGLQFM